VYGVLDGQPAQWIYPMCMKFASRGHNKDSVKVCGISNSHESTKCAIMLRQSKTDGSRNGRWIALGPQEPINQTSPYKLPSINNLFKIKKSIMVLP